MLAKDFLPTSGPTKDDLRAGLTVLLAVSEAIREAREIPEGTLYAAVMGKVDLAGFEKILGILWQAGLIERKNHVVRWVGPTLEQDVKEVPRA